jgi:5'-deoxynucleotidase YfbR-like HD superfamily hydrolase
MSTELVKKFRAGMAVRRYHTVNLIVGETVGHHSCNVAWLVTLLTEEPSTALIQAALLHDVAEQWTGDVPATAKWMSSNLHKELNALEDNLHMYHELWKPDLTPEEAAILKQADMLDLCFKMVEELEMGNQYARPILVRGIEWLMAHNPSEVTLELLRDMEMLRHGS